MAGTSPSVNRGSISSTVFAKRGKDLAGISDSPGALIFVALIAPSHHVGTRLLAVSLRVSCTASTAIRVLAVTTLANVPIAAGSTT